MLFPPYLLLVCILATGCSDHDPESVFHSFSWKQTTPEAQAINGQILDSAFISAKNKGYVDGLLIIRHGFLVAEQYYNGYHRDKPHNVKSVSKSFLSALMGILLQKGHLTLEEKVMDYFPEYVYDTMDARKYDITIDHLMIMRMGINTEDNNLLDVLSTPNWIKSTIELPLLSAPGEKFRYNTLETHLLSAILTKISGQTTFELMKELLTDPMGIDIDNWTRDPQGYFFGGSEMYFTPREMAVLGFLYLNKGKLRDQQIVPADWVDASLARTWLKDSKEWGVLKEYNYGHLWWLGKINGIEMFWALGYGGQMVLTFPDLDLIVVTTAGYDIGWDVDQERPILEIVSKYILPAVN
jgi:CubicO group peptidase (beta-lactamase class C family)